MAFEFPQYIQDKLDTLSSREFESVMIHFELPARETEVKNARYKELKEGWECVYPKTPEAYEFLDKVIIAVKKRDEPPLLENMHRQAPPIGNINNQPCFMHQHATRLERVFELVATLTQPDLSCMICRHKP